MKKIMFFLLFNFFTIISAGVVYSEEPEKVDTVVVTGMGINADKARQNAVRNAVEQVVGAYVTSEIMVENSALIKDEIMSHSGGYVQSTKVLSTEKTDEGLYSVKVEAKVVSTRLVRKLQDLNITIKKIDNKGLFSAALSKIDSDRSKKDVNASSADLLDITLAKFPSAAYKIKIGESEITSADSASNIASMNIPLSITWDNDFIGEFIEVIKKTQTDLLEFGTSTDISRLNSAASAGKDQQVQRFVLCFSNKSSMEIDKTPNLCVVPEGWYNYMDRKNGPRSSFFITIHGRGDYLKKTGWLYVTIKFKNNKKATIKTVKHFLPLSRIPNSGIFAINGSQAHVIVMDDEQNIKVPIKIDTKTLNDTVSLEATIGADWN